MFKRIISMFFLVISASERFLNIDGTKIKRKISGYDVEDTIASKQAFIENVAKDTGRYEVYCAWKGNLPEAHVFIVERQPDGNLLWFDPQSGRHGAPFFDFLKKARRFNIAVTRIDDKIINPVFAERFKKASK